MLLGLWCRLEAAAALNKTRARRILRAEYVAKKKEKKKKNDDDDGDGDEEGRGNYFDIQFSSSLILAKSPRL